MKIPPMNEKMTTLDKPESNEEKMTGLKRYKKPKLTIYGDISKLILSNPGSGSDGGPPFMTSNSSA